jgi:hypothetical protein
MGRVLVRGAGQVTEHGGPAAAPGPGPVGLDITAGEYGFLLPDFTALAGAVDCLQADVTRCGGMTGLQVGGLTEAPQIDSLPVKSRGRGLDGKTSRAGSPAG